MKKCGYGLSIVPHNASGILYSGVNVIFIDIKEKL